MESCISSDLLNVPLEAWNCAQAMNSLARSELFQSYICRTTRQDPLPDFSISFNNFMGRMKRCFFMNEKLQLLDLAAEISKKPSREECCFIAGPLLFSTGTSRKMSVGFHGGCSQERDSCGKTKKIFLPGSGEKKSPQAEGTLVLF